MFTFTYISKITAPYIFSGQYHQCDSVMYPEVLPKTSGSGGWRAWNLFKYFSSSSSGEDRNIPSHELVQQKLLPLYLENRKDMLLKMEVKDIYWDMMYIKAIFNQIESPKVYHSERGNSWPAKSVSNVSYSSVGLTNKWIPILFNYQHSNVQIIIDILNLPMHKYMLYNFGYT